MIYPGFDEGVRKIWARDEQSQKHYLGNIGESVRELPFEAFRKFNAFFVPNDSYIQLYFGPQCQNPQYELYYGNICTMCNHIVFPFYNLLNQVVGWCCFKPFDKLRSVESGEYGVSCYEYPTSTTFNKGKYVFTLPNVFQKAMKDEYIIITDGVFDTVSFVHYGLNACSVLGSRFNPWLAFYFRFIKKVFVSIDNDAAGMKLYRDVQRLIPNARKLRQSVGKDSDDTLKSVHRDQYIKEVMSGVDRDVDVLFRQKIYID